MVCARERKNRIAGCTELDFTGPLVFFWVAVAGMALYLLLRYRLPLSQLFLIAVGLRPSPRDTGFAVAKWATLLGSVGWATWIVLACPTVA